jgi:hypothetical protein
MQGDRAWSPIRLENEKYGIDVCLHLERFNFSDFEPSTGRIGVASLDFDVANAY